MPTLASQQALVGLRDLSILCGGTACHWFKPNKNKVIAISSLYGIAIIANGVAMGLLGWNY